jgi:uncharacterized membrane protein
VPGDPTSDHAEKLLDVSDVIRGQHPIFFPRNTGREPAQFYFTYLLIKVFGLSLSFQTLKIGTALIGALAIPAVFLLATEVAGHLAGLVAAALFAVSKWPLEVARLGLRMPYASLAAALVLWLLLRYLRRGDRRDALACGLVLGMGLHGYTAFRAVPLLVVMLLSFALVVGRSDARRTAVDGGLLLGTALLACLPLAHYTIRHPDLVFYRAGTRIEFDGFDTLGTFGHNVLNALLAFNWRGDAGWVSSVRFDPLLDVVTAGALIAGIVLLCFRLAIRQDPLAFALLLSVPVLMLPSTVNISFPIENPSVPRLSAAMPAVFTIAALPFALLGERVQARRSRLIPAVALVSLSGIVFLTAEQSFVRYFREYRVQYHRSVPHTHEVVAALRSRAGRRVDLDDTYLLNRPFWLDGRNVALALGARDWYLQHDIGADRRLPARPNSRALLFVVNIADALRRSELRDRFPAGRYVLVHDDIPGHSFALYLVPAKAPPTR